MKKKKPPEGQGGDRDEQDHRYHRKTIWEARGDWI